MGMDPNKPKTDHAEEPFACPEGERLWNLYRESVPWGLKVPPACPEDFPDAEQEFLDFFEHVNGCDDCNEN